MSDLSPGCVGKLLVFSNIEFVLMYIKLYYKFYLFEY